MKTRLYLSAFYLIVTMTVTCHAHGQEGSGPEMVESEMDLVDKEIILLSPGEKDTRYVSETVKTSTTTDPKDSTATNASSTTTNAALSAIPPAKIKTEKPAPSPKPPVEKQSKEEADDSILSFNFLYYIIQKYKMQDIVD